MVVVVVLPFSEFVVEDLGVVDNEAVVCSIDLTVMHPDLFTTFEDIAGDRGPGSGTKQQIIDQLYGGNAAQWDAFDPRTVMAKRGPYPGSPADSRTPSHRRMINFAHWQALSKIGGSRSRHRAMAGTTSGTTTTRPARRRICARPRQRSTSPARCTP